MWPNICLYIEKHKHIKARKYKNIDTSKHKYTFIYVHKRR